MPGFYVVPDTKADNEEMSEETSKTGRLVIISGPSSVGKSTICKKVVERLDNAYISVSLTTRPKSDKEIDGRDYWFVTKEQFQQRIENGSLLEYAEVFGNLYGTPTDKVDESLQAGEIVILEIDVQGARQVKVHYPDAAMVFILPPSQKELTERMNGRGRESAEAAARRLNWASSEIAAAWQYYEHMVINEDLEQAVNEVIEIIEAIGE